MSTSVILKDILLTLCGTGFLGAWILERRKRKASAVSIEVETEGKRIENQSKEADLYQKILDDLETRYEKKYNEVVAMFEQKVKILEEDIKLHKRIQNSLKRENAELRKRIKQYET